MLPSKSESLAQYNAKSGHVWKKTDRNYSFCILLNFGVVLIVSSQCSYPKLRLRIIKKYWNNFCFIMFLFASAPKVCLRFSNISNWGYWYFYPSWCHFYYIFISTIYFQIKRSFCCKKGIHSGIWDTFVEELLKFGVEKY